MRRLLLRYQRELTVFVAVLIATGGFAVAAFVSEGSQAVGAGTYVVRSDTSGLLVTGEVVDVTTNARGRTVRVVKWRTRQGETVTRTLRAEGLSSFRLTVTETGATITAPAVTQRQMLTVHEIETVVETQVVLETQTLTETVVVTETVPDTGTVGPDGQ